MWFTMSHPAEVCDIGTSLIFGAVQPIVEETLGRSLMPPWFVRASFSHHVHSNAWNLIGERNPTTLFKVEQTPKLPHISFQAVFTIVRTHGFVQHCRCLSDITIPELAGDYLTR